MFWKKKKLQNDKKKLQNDKKKLQNDKKKLHEAYDVAYENLAVPEVHTDLGVEEEDSKEEEGSITYESVAIPEVHIRRK